MHYSTIKMAVGAFVFATFLVVIGAVFYLLNAKGAFDQRYPFDFYTKSAQSFEVGMPILFSGFQVGVIDKIDLTDEGEVHIIFSVDEHNRRWLTENSELMLKKPLIGSPYVELHADIKSRLLVPGSTLPINISDDINDIINKLEPTVNKLIEVVDNLHKISAGLANEEGQLFNTLSNIETFSGKLAESDSLLTTLTGNQQASRAAVDAVEKIRDLVYASELTLKKVDGLVEGMEGKVVDPSGEILQQVDVILNDITDKLNKLQATVDAVGSSDQDIVKLREQILMSIERSNRLIEQVDSILNEPQSKTLELP